MKNFKFSIIFIVAFISIYWLSAILVSSSSFNDFETGMLTIFTILSIILCSCLVLYIYRDIEHRIIGWIIQLFVGILIGYLNYSFSISINSSIDPIAIKQHNAILYSLFIVSIFQFAFMFTLIFTNKKEK